MNARTNRQTFTACKAIVWKEWCENWWLAGVASLVLLWLIGMEAGVEISVFPMQISTSRLNSPTVPFTHDFLFSGVAWCGFLLGTTIGLHQTFGERWRGTWPFLLHRPIPRPTLIYTKLFTGLTLVWGATGVPLLLYVLWLVTGGTGRVPFYTWMVVPVLWTWLWGGVAYLSAFLCGQRPARWYGSRMLPLVSSGWMLMFMYMSLAGTPAFAMPLLWGSLIVCLLAIWQVIRVNDFA